VLEKARIIFVSWPDARRKEFLIDVRDVMSKPAQGGWLFDGFLSTKLSAFKDSLKEEGLFDEKKV